ncbi:MAG: TIGR00730 family Rossman fold protein [Cyclobacteriaceae bacterium]|nr:TIGR00730 family Rossman fold protein [Cyclobacteriaceae bacterium]MCX7636471.1 TIGR00730 family Rossman fold protein [Cyclobacteriaceae bacterium]MDW8330790.1 TIGR00730 family Rossman fold protein [Cyclobacteriaceae bacterium]
MNVCIFCGSAAGRDSVFAEAARTTGHLIAAQQHTLIYGGGNIGLMGIVADAVLQKGGSVIGVIPEFLLEKEVGHTGLTQLIVVKTMHERKQKMADLADAFIMLPGGWGTLDETAEILTWKQLGLIRQPVAILNSNGFYDPLIRQIDVMVEQGFLKPVYRDMILIGQSPEEVLHQLTSEY